MKRIGSSTSWLTLSLLAVMALCVTPSSAGEPPQVRVRADFDNAYIQTTRLGDRHLEIEVIAPDGPVLQGDRRPPMNIALVIDKSGSMAHSGKMTYVKEAARKMLDRLTYGDRFAIVTYDDDVRVLVRSEEVEDPSRARGLIDRLSPGGSTNLGAGLEEGYAQVRRHYIPGGTNRVLLLSDGLANRGITSARELSRIAGREGRRGISLATFGVGLDFNEDLLASMAESGRGTYYYIDRPQRIPEILAREFSLIQRIVALDVIITIEVRPEVVIHDVMGYEYLREGSRYRVRIGDLAAGERRRIMARLSTPAYDPGDHSIGNLRMEYQLRGKEETVTSSQELRLRYVEDHSAVERNLNEDVAARSAVYGANVARRKAAELVDRGDMEGAREVLEESRRSLKHAPVQSAEIGDELAETERYQESIEKPMSPEEKAAVQKDVKYRSYKVLQSK